MRGAGRWQAGAPWASRLRLRSRGSAIPIVPFCPALPAAPTVQHYGLWHNNQGTWVFGNDKRVECEGEPLLAAPSCRAEAERAKSRLLASRSPALPPARSRWPSLVQTQWSPSPATTPPLDPSPV